MKEYFPHDYNARNSLQLQALMGECGEGSYGIFWALVELLHEMRNRVPMKQYIYSGIADQIKTTPEKVEKIVSVCLRLELFVEKCKFFSSNRVRSNRTKRLAISKIRAKSGKRGAIAKQNLAKKRKEKEKKGNKRKVNEIIDPFGGLEFWQGWKDYKKQEHNETYKSEKTEQAAIQKLYELSGGDKERARLILEQSIANSWKGIFELKTNGHETNFGNHINGAANKREKGIDEWGQGVH